MPKILIVEDMKVWRQFIASALASTQAVLTFVEDGKLAVEAIQSKHSFDAIIMNIKMPVMNGYEATRRIRKLGFKNPIIGNSFLYGLEDVRSAFAAGMSHYLFRTNDPEDLYRALHHLGILKEPKARPKKWNTDLFFIK